MKYTATIVKGDKRLKRVSHMKEKSAREYMESLAVVAGVTDYVFAPGIANELRFNGLVVRLTCEEGGGKPT